MYEIKIRESISIVKNKLQQTQNNRKRGCDYLLETNKEETSEEIY